MTKDEATIQPDVMPVLRAIERAAIRDRQFSHDNMVARLDVILEEFANILGAYVEYRAEVLAARAAHPGESP